MARKRLRAHRNELPSIVSTSSIWIALLAMHRNTRPQRFEFAAPPIVLLVCTVHDPNTSMSTLVKGKPTSDLSGGMP